MAQFAVFGVGTIPALGTATHALVYRGDHVDSAAAVQAAADMWAISTGLKIWAVPVGSLTQYRVDISTTRTPTLE